MSLGFTATGANTTLATGLFVFHVFHLRGSPICNVNRLSTRQHVGHGNETNFRENHHRSLNPSKHLKKQAIWCVYTPYLAYCETLESKRYANLSSAIRAIINQCKLAVLLLLVKT